MITAIFSYVLVPLATLFLARGTGYFSTNFSSIRFSFSRQGEFLLWCALTGGYFFLSLRRIVRRAGAPYASRPTDFFLSAGAALTAAFALTPYLPNRFPRLSFVHVLSALAASLALFFCLLLLSVKIYLAQPDLGRPFLLILIAAASFCLTSWILSGIINTAMEVCLVLTACYLIRRFSLVFVNS